MRSPRVVKVKTIVVIGAESAGLTSAASARLRDRDARIVVMERNPYPLYHPCGIPFAIGGRVRSISDLVEQKPRLQNVEMKTSTEARAIDIKDKEVEAIDLKTSKEEVIQYDSLVIATGSLPIRPPIHGIDLENVFTVHSISDGERIIAAVQTAKKALIIGGGLIGIETAEALRERGLEVTVVEMLPSVLANMLDADMSEIVLGKLREIGINVMCGRKVEEIVGDGRVSKVRAGGEEFPADLVIVAAGFRPNVELARAAGIEIGITRAIKVDERLMTSAEDVYAAGDCVEARHLITGKPTLSQLATTAIRMGRVAGANAAGGNENFPGVLNTAVTSIHGLEVASTGLTSQAADSAGIKPVSMRVRVLDKPRYYPGAQPITIKLIADSNDGRLIGGQVIGNDAGARVNLLAFAIRSRTTVWELSKMEYCYAPPVVDDIEPLIVAADALARRLA
ncbi:MAG: hypothetical protein APU95_03435 [Hadesarchaea archaeon YNP_N21]|nr:MAG: hypothetical protein APU95_03435 [Hadesarchaea archaeon YNP_N21]